MWGTWSLGLFASGKYGATGATGPDNSAPVTGWFYGGGPTVFEAQLIGSLTICAATLGVSLIMMWVIKQLPHPWNLRVEPEGEKIGLDIWEHGTEAYPAQ
jgi:Amt family ammonium transporter